LRFFEWKIKVKAFASCWTVIRRKHDVTDAAQCRWRSSLWSGDYVSKAAVSMRMVTFQQRSCKWRNSKRPTLTRKINFDWAPVAQCDCLHFSFYLKNESYELMKHHERSKMSRTPRNRRVEQFNFVLNFFIVVSDGESAFSPSRWKKNLHRFCF
jgi:hypothetical protein